VDSAYREREGEVALLFDGQQSITLAETLITSLTIGGVLDGLIVAYSRLVIRREKVR